LCKCLLLRLRAYTIAEKQAGWKMVHHHILPQVQDIVGRLASCIGIAWKLVGRPPKRVSQFKEGHPAVMVWENTD